MKRKLLFYFCTIALITTVAIYFLFIFRLRNNYAEEVEGKITTDAKMVVSLLEQIETDEYDTLLTDVFQHRYEEGLRVSIIGRDGKVLYDSSFDTSFLENHGDREEIQFAMEGKKGRTIRFSNSLGKQMMYIALPLETSHTQLSVARVAFPMENIYSYANRFIDEIAMIFILMIGLAVFFATKLSNDFTKTSELMINAIKRLTKGYYGESLICTMDNEFNELCMQINAMASSQKQRVEKLTQSNHNYSSILSSILSPVIVLDRQKKVAYINKSAENFLNATEKEVIGRHFIEAFRHFDLMKFIDCFYEGSGENSFEFEQGSSVYRFNIFRNEGLFNEFKDGVVLLSEDITDVKRLENVRKEFVTNVTHELKTPLTSIKGYAELLKEQRGIDDENRNRFIEIIEIEADRLSNLINDLLTLSEVENNPGHITAFEVNQTVTETIRMLRKLADDKGITLNWHSCETIEIEGDRNRFKQMLINLVDNAIKYSDRNGKVSIKTAVENNHLLLEVQDDGMGIGEEHLNRLFERFYRTDQSRSRQEGGTGLGLAIVKHIVRSFNGDIRVESKLGEGSRFMIILPMSEAIV
jgi:two-component system phosphate regulon sensor histidine kinase PhoR